MSDTKPAAETRKPAAPAPEMAGYAYLRGEFVPLAEASVSIATHALHYGTGCFEGIRGYYNPEHEQLYVLKLQEHYERMQRSCRIVRIDPGMDAEEMSRITLELLRRNGFRQDVYIRPIAFKGTPTIGLRLTGLEDAFAIYCRTLGEYLDVSKGLHCAISSWPRPDDTTMPVRAKVTGAYINSCLASDDAKLAGFDEAIQLTRDGHVSEGSSCNLFMVRNGRVTTTQVTDAILEGVTRAAILELARDLGLPVDVRRIDRSELFVAEEVFFVGTGVQVAPVTQINHRPIGDGRPGPVMKRIQQAYFRAARGDDPAYRHWLTAVYDA